jgi:hypothetical protein
MFDDAWGHADESLLTALDKLTADEAQWQHAAYAVVPAFPSMPPPGTVLWQIAHLEHSARHYAEIIRQRPLSEEPITAPPSTCILEDLLTALYQAHAHFREVIAELPENGVDQPCVRGMNVAEFTRMAVRHSTWHASQIATVRRLYRYQCW